MKNINYCDVRFKLITNSDMYFKKVLFLSENTRGFSVMSSAFEIDRLITRRVFFIK